MTMMRSSRLSWFLSVALLLAGAARAESCAADNDIEAATKAAI